MSPALKIARLEPVGREVRELGPLGAGPGLQPALSSLDSPVVFRATKREPGELPLPAGAGSRRTWTRTRALARLIPW